MEQIQRDFLWGEGNFERKSHLVKWPTVCSNKIKGGLGVRRLALLNKLLASGFSDLQWKGGFLRLDIQACSKLENQIKSTNSFTTSTCICKITYSKS